MDARAIEREDIDREVRRLDTEEAVAASWDADRERLEQNGYAVRMRSSG